jgi:aspartyl/asparaginyl beta-hydroxylase (cupin superfamily)
MAQGKPEEAAVLWRQVLQAEPGNAEAYLHLGQIALLAHDLGEARRFLEAARNSAPDNPAICLNLAFVFRAVGDQAGEGAALADALSIDPYFYPALLARGAMEERLGEMRAASETYRCALKIVPPLDQMPEPLRKRIAHAEEVVRADRSALEELLQPKIDALSARYPAEKLERISHCKDWMVGSRKIYSPEPAMLHIPYLPALQFYDNAAFPWLESLEAAAEGIRDEFLKVFAEDNEDGFRPYINRPDGVPLNQWQELNRNPRWSVFPLWENGQYVESNGRRCPHTVEVLRGISMCTIPNFAPNVVFSLLAPKTTIPAHCGDTNARLIGHLPLIVPEGCRFRVGNETRPWRVGKAWLFDDTINHEAWNDSDQLRVILMIDIWNPFLSGPEREGVSALLNGVNEHKRRAGNCDPSVGSGFAQG